MLEEYTLEEPKQQGRSPDSLIQAIDRIERLEKQLKIAVEGLELIANYGVSAWDIANAKHCLKQIKELEK